MSRRPDLLEYYAARADEYEKVYAKPERKDDLARLHDAIPAYFVGRRVLEIACGTGYWTRLIAPRAVHTTACDLTLEVLTIARLAQPEDDAVSFEVADAFNLDDVPGQFDAAFAGFWWSHVELRDLPRFLGGLHARLEPGSRVMFVDNQYVDGSNWPVTRVDAAGNTYQRRTLDNGDEFDVLKNFPSADALETAIASAGGENVAVVELLHYWCATYEVSERSARAARAR